MLSADGTPWLMHDETLERTSSGAGRMCDTPDVELRKLDAGSYRHGAFAGESLPTFEQAAQLCRELGLLVNVEIKPAEGFEQATGEQVAHRVLDLWQGAALPLVSSFSETALQAARRVAPNLPLGFLCEQPPIDWLHRVEAVGAFSLHCAAGLVDDDVLHAAILRSIPVLCWTVNDRRSAEALLERGVAAIFSDRPDLMSGL